MSAVDDELEEGEITDSDSMGEEDKTESKPTEKLPAQQYSLFGDPPRTTSSQRPIPPPPSSDSCSSDSDSDYSDEDMSNKKQKRLRNSGTALHNPKPFVNPNFVNNGGAMPPVPKPSNKSIWSSVLQEQILTAEVGNFSMEKKVISDRNVESYDYSRAKEDDRPFPVEDDLNVGEGDLFGEVIDLEKSAFKQRKTLKRKHVGERLGRRRDVKERLDLPPVTANSSVEEVTYFVSAKLQENKVHLIRRVVKVIGQTMALDFLRKTEEIEAAGGMMVMNGSRRRTKGGVYLTLLKSDPEVTKEQQDEIFEEENQRALELRKWKKARSRKRKQSQNKQQQSKKPTTEDKDTPSSMEVAEEGNSRSSVEGQTGSPQTATDHLSDTQESCAGRGQADSEDADSDCDAKNEAEEDFDNQLQRELKRQAAAQESKETAGKGGDGDAVTLDDVLDIGVDEDFID